MKRNVKNAIIHKMNTLITIIRVGKTRHNTSKYILLNLYFPTINRWLAYIRCEFHIIENLRVYTLIGIDIIMPEYVHLDFDRSIITVVACENAKFNILIIILDFIAKVVFSKVRIRIPAKLDKLILIIGSKHKPLNLPHNKDFIF